MAPDRGRSIDDPATMTSPSDNRRDDGDDEPSRPSTPVGRGRSSNDRLLTPPHPHGAGRTPSKARPVIEGQSFTLRGVAVGLAIGLVLTCTNISMGLQSGWVSAMTMPASL